MGEWTFIALTVKDGFLGMFHGDIFAYEDPQDGAKVPVSFQIYIYK